MTTTTITCRCPLCGAVSTVVAPTMQVIAYMNGALAQEAFVDMDLRARESIISGMCYPCQESFFEEEEDDCDGICDLCSLQDECVGSDIL